MNAGDLNRDAHATASVSTTPSSTLPTYSISVGGLSLTNCTSAGIVSSREYDALGRAVASTDGRGNATAVFYDAQGRVAWTESPLPLGEGQGEGTSVARTTYAYDALGRQVAVTNALGEATYTAYDAEGRVISTWGATYPVAYEYDAHGRMTTMATTRDSEVDFTALAAELVTGASLESLASLMSLDRTTWLYEDATGVLTNKVYADGKGPRYTYTPDGKLATRTWARGLVASYVYDASGKLLSLDYSDTTPDVAFTYDRLGRQLSAIAAGVSTNFYAYSRYGQLTNEVSYGQTVASALSRTTDTLGRSTGLSVAGVGDPGSPYAVEYGYDAYGRFTSVVAEGGGLPSPTTFTYSYLPDTSLVSGMTASTGHAWTRSYESNRNLISAVENTYGESVISRFDYANDEIGRRTAISRSGTALDTPVRDAYGYNARSEVTSARRALASNPNQEVRGFSYDYAYDPIGNRTSSTEYDHEDHARVSSYTANELNQYEQRTVPGFAGVRGSATNTATVTVNGTSAWRLGEYFYGGDDIENAASAVMKELDITAVVNPAGTNEADLVQSVTGKVFVAKSPEAFTYDDDGNMLSDERFVYTWDGENRLVKVEARNDLPASVPRVKVTYQYDSRSRRIGKVVSHFENDTWTVAESRSFVYDNWNMVQEFSTFSIPSFHSSTNSYVWGLDLSGSLQGAGGVGGLLAVIKDSATYSPAWDANGNVMEYVSTDGTLAAHYEYSPFGETVIQSGELADVFAFRFSTKYWENEAKLYNYSYRYYAPAIGHWLSRDSIGESGGINIYNFVFNCALMFFDSNGRAPQIEGVDSNGNGTYTPDTDWGDNPLGGGRGDPGTGSYAPYIPDTSDGFGFMEAVLAYYFGQGADVTIPFNTIDQGFGVADFTSFDPCSYGIGTFNIDRLTKLHDFFTLRTLDQAGPGRIVFQLDGRVTLGENRKWSFSGQLTAVADKFNFDPKDGFGERDGEPSWLQYYYEFASYPLSCMSRYRLITYPKETITRFVHDLDQTPLRGQGFTVTIKGSRSVEASGCCDK